MACEDDLDDELLLWAEYHIGECTAGSDSGSVAGSYLLDSDVETVGGASPELTTPTQPEEEIPLASAEKLPETGSKKTSLILLTQPSKFHYVPEQLPDVELPQLAKRRRRDQRKRHWAHTAPTLLLEQKRRKAVSNQDLRRVITANRLDKLQATAEQPQVLQPPASPLPSDPPLSLKFNSTKEGSIFPSRPGLFSRHHTTFTLPHLTPPTSPSFSLSHLRS